MGKGEGGPKKPSPPKENRGYSLRMGCTLLAPQQAQRYVVQQQGEAPADQRRRCPERSGSSPGSSWPVAERTKKRSGSGRVLKSYHNRRQLLGI